MRIYVDVLSSGYEMTWEDDDGKTIVASVIVRDLGELSAVIEEWEDREAGYPWDRGLEGYEEEDAA